MPPPHTHTREEGQHRFPIAKILFATIASALLIVGLTIAITPAEEAPLGPSQALPGGGELRIKAVLGGTKYFYSTQSRMQRMASNLPRFIRRMLPLETAYYQKREPGPNRTLCIVLQSEPDKHFEMMGFPFRSVLRSPTGWAQERSGVEFLWPTEVTTARLQVLPMATFNAVPPNLKDLTFELYPGYNNDGSPPFAKWSVENPAYDSAYKQMVGKPLPLSTSDHLLSVTLVRLVTGVDTSWFYRIPDEQVTSPLTLVPHAPQKNTLPAAWLALAIEEQSNGAAEWRVEKLNASSPAGTIVDASGTRQHTLHGIRYYQFEPILPHGMGAFNLKLQLTRDKNYPSDELWTFDVAVPTTSTIVSDGQAHEFGATRAWIQGVGGPQALSPEGGCSGTHMLIELAETRSTTDTRVLHIVGGVDNLGRNLRAECTSQRGPKTAGLPHVHSFTLFPQQERGKPAATAGEITSATLTVAFTRPHDFTFQAEPELATAAPAESETLSK